MSLVVFPIAPYKTLTSLGASWKIHSLYVPLLFLKPYQLNTVTYWQAYHQLGEITDDTKKLTRENICRIHNYLMRNSRVMPDSDLYMTPGSTRSLTRKTVIVLGVTKIQCCPYPAVDDELDYMCKMAVVSTIPLTFEPSSLVTTCKTKKKI